MAVAGVSNAGESFEILRELEDRKFQIKFSDGTVLIKDKYSVLKGKVRNPNRKSYFDIGFEGIGIYRIYEGSGKKSKAGTSWVGMLRRCYDLKYREDHTSYENCQVAEEWHNFQNFAEWYYKQPSSSIECELDKDILLLGNKLYCKELCCLVPKILNRTFIRNESAKGVQKTASGSFRAVCRVLGKRITKCFDNFEDAQKFYKQTKENGVKVFILDNLQIIDQRIFDKYFKQEEK